jgi:hypothetical protein
MNPAEEPNRDRSKWVRVFDELLMGMAGMYNRQWIPPGSTSPCPGFPYPVQKAYMEVCEGWSIAKMCEVFRKAMQLEKFCPVAATLRAYGEGVREEMAPPVREEKRPQYTPEEREDIRRMIAELKAKFAASPYLKPLPDFFTRGGL